MYLCKLVEWQLAAFHCKSNWPSKILSWKPELKGSVQWLSCIRLFEIPWTAACQASLSITNSQTLFKHVHWVGDAIQPSHPLSSPFPPAFNAPLVSLIFLKRSLVLPILLFSSVSLHCSLRKPFLSLLSILWTAFRWLYLSFSPLSLASLLFSGIF